MTDPKISITNFTQFGLHQAREQRRKEPKEEHFSAVWSFAHREKTGLSIDEIAFALKTICQWIWRVDRPTFHCQRASLFESVIAAAWCGVALRQWGAVTATELAAYAGLSYDSIVKSARDGKLCGQPQCLAPLSVRAFLESRGVNFDDPA